MREFLESFDELVVHGGPTGRLFLSPGQRPGITRSNLMSPEGATFTRSILWPPLQGSSILLFEEPRALPWA